MTGSYQDLKSKIREVFFIRVVYMCTYRDLSKDPLKKDKREMTDRRKMKHKKKKKRKER